MRNRKARIVALPAILLVVSMMLLGGCTHADSEALEAFVTDMLRGVASALLL